jgi:hypothetical protein
MCLFTIQGDGLFLCLFFVFCLVCFPRQLFTNSVTLPLNINYHPFLQAAVTNSVTLLSIVFPLYIVNIVDLFCVFFWKKKCHCDESVIMIARPLAVK